MECQSTRPGIIGAVRIPMGPSSGWLTHSCVNPPVCRNWSLRVCWSVAESLPVQETLPLLSSAYLNVMFMSVSCQSATRPPLMDWLSMNRLLPSVAHNAGTRHLRCLSRRVYDRRVLRGVRHQRRRARSEFTAAFAWLSARHIHFSLGFSATACLSVEVSVKAPFSSGLATPLVSAVHWSATDDVSRYLVDGWIMVGAQCRAHVTLSPDCASVPLDSI